LLMTGMIDLRAARRPYSRPTLVKAATLVSVTAAPQPTSGNPNPQ
jgi:hypothetical protein